MIYINVLSSQGSSAVAIKSDFEKWTDSLTEVRYSELVSDEMLKIVSIRNQSHVLLVLSNW